MNLNQRIARMEDSFGGHGCCPTCGGKRDATLYDVLKLSNAGQGSSVCWCRGTPLGDLLEALRQEAQS